MADIKHTILDDGIEEWRLNGLLHRTDGPALIFSNGEMQWWYLGEHHREDGPAVIYPDGSKEWWLLTKNYSFSKWLKELEYHLSNEKLIELKLIYG